MSVRFARPEDLERVNELRRQVNDVHVAGRPDVFKPGFPAELRDHVYTIFNDPDQKIAVYELNGNVVAAAVLKHHKKPESPFSYANEFLDIDEICVDEKYRRRGIASEMMDFIREYAKSEGFKKIELNMWEFNQGALAFYEEIGFKTYRRYMELPV